MQMVSHNWRFCISPDFLGFWGSDTEVPWSLRKQQVLHDPSVLLKDTGVLVWELQTNLPTNPSSGTHTPNIPASSSWTLMQS